MKLYHSPASPFVRKVVVLLHELGHHVDADNFRNKSHKKSEAFAEWFASEHGYRLRSP